MFCKNCGAPNFEHSGYCVNDGADLNKKNKNVGLRADNNKFCPDCGSISDEHDLYCVNCGKSYYSVDKSRKKDFDLGINLDSLNLDSLNLDSLKKANINISEDVELGNIGSFNLKRSVVFAGLGFIALLVFSLILSTGLNELAINSGNGFFTGLGTELGVDKIFNMFDLALLSNNASLKLSAGGEYLEGKTLFNMGHIYFFSLPAIIFIIVGVLSSVRDKKDGESLNILSLVATGLIYGILVFLLALLYRSSINIPESFFTDQIKIRKSYTVLEALVKSSLIAIVFSGVGYNIHSFISGRRKDIGEFKEVLDGFSLMAIVYFVSTLLGFFLLASTDYQGTESVILVTLASYGLGLVNFGKLVGGEEGYTEAIGLYTRVGDNESILSNPEFGPGLKFGAIILLLIPIGIFLYYGMKNKKERDKKVFIAPFAYSFTLLLIVSLIKTKMAGNLDSFSGSFEFGLNSLGIFVNTLILSLAPTIAGYLFSGREENE